MDTPSSQQPLITTKWSIPRLGRDLIDRTNLIKKLDHGLDRKLTLVSAPAGYGKTTLIRQWLEGSSYPIAWLSLDENDKDPAIFLTYFIAAIRTFKPDAGKDVLSSLEAPQRPHPDYLSSTIIHELTNYPEPYLVVLDDYHNIDSSEIHQMMEMLITYMQPEMHLVMISRRDFPFPLVCLRVGQEMTEIRLNELRFSLREEAEYLVQATEKELNEETLTILDRRTEGWIAALRLVAIALRNEKDPDEYVRSFKGSHRNLMDYLASEVISHQQTEVQEFLFKTSILDRFCAPICAEMTTNSINRCQKIIEELEQENLFIIPLDEERGWYRYHQLFREMLLHRKRAIFEHTEVTGLHQSAAQWFGEHGFIHEAIRHFLAAEDIKSAIDLINQHRHKLLDQSGWRELESWLRLIPQAKLRSDPSLLVAQSWMLLHTLNLEEMIRYLQTTEEQLDNNGAAFSEDTSRALRGEIDTMWSYYWNVAGNDPKKAYDHAERALNNLPPTHAFAWGLALDFVCFAQYFRGHTEAAARELFEAAYSTSPLGPSKLQTFIGLCHLNLISGNLPGLLKSANDFLQFSSENNLSIGIAYAHYFIGTIKYEWNELIEATHHLSQVAQMHYGASTIVYTNSMYLLALTHQALGESEKVSEILATTEAYLIEVDNKNYFAELESIRARLALLADDLDEAVRLTEKVKLSDLRDSPFVFEAKGITCANVLIEQRTESSLEMAIQYLQQNLAVAEATNNIRRMIPILAQLALAYDYQGRTEEAYTALERSIALGEPGVFLRTFVDLGAPMSWMLRQLLDRGVAIQYLRKILAAYPESEQRKVNLDGDAAILIRESSKALLLEPLTKRECEILLQLAERRSNQEIADQLTISVYTVKKHTTNMYQKLRVNDREEAVEKAKSLGLLTINTPQG